MVDLDLEKFFDRVNHDKLMIGRDLASRTAGSPHGPWHVANSPGLSYSLPIAYFDSLGLPRLFDGDA